MQPSKLVMASLMALAPAVVGLEARAATGMATQPAAPVPAQADPQRILKHFKALTAKDRTARSAAPAVRATAADGDPVAEYIATQLMGYGLAPAGDAGTYFQTVPMTEVRTLPETSLIAVASDLSTLSLRNLEDVVAFNQTQAPSAYVDAPIVFVGYGIQAPGSGRDDYRGLDLDGKVALLLAGDPPGGAEGFRRRTHYGSPEYKFAEAARHGAVAALLVPEPGATADSWNGVRGEWGTARSYRGGDATPRLRAASWIRADAARRVVAMAGLDLDALAARAQAKDFSPIEFPLRLQAHVASEVRPVGARNVLAALPGRGTSSREAVVYTARYDRLPSGAAPEPNGLEGDRAGSAVGVAALLETARLWAQHSSVPPRTILFLVLAGENHGLPAADDFVARESAVPPGRISVALNFEPQAPDGDARTLAVRGATRTSFSPTVAATAKTLALTIDSDPYPASAREYDSGAYGLALAGVPSISLAAGKPSTDPAPPVRSAPEGHLAADQFAGDARLARLGYELGVRAAAQKELIGWLPDDEFEAVRKRSQLATHKPLERKPKRVR
jgi:Zn-dependent M28 family amino/carboxypeptidase